MNNYYTGSPDLREGAYADHLSDLDREEEARDAFCLAYIESEIAALEVDPMGQWSNGDSAWTRYTEYESRSCNSREEVNSAMIMALVTMREEVVEDLKTISSALHDAVEQLRQDFENLLLEEAAGNYDTAKRQGGVDYD